MTTKKKARKRKIIPMPERGLHNWPPSRGPMPTEMRHKDKYVIPDPEIETVEWVSDTKRYRFPATPIKVVPTKAAPKRKKRPRGVFSIQDMINSFDAKCEVDISLGHHVATIATLRPEHWRLVGGAELVPGRTVNSRGGKSKSHRVKAGVRFETYLPKQSYTFDLSYPMDRICRVTIRPYTIVGYRGHKYEEVNVGYVLWQLARAYKLVYKQWRKYGIWGHAIGDLVFERIQISNNVGEVSIGS